MTIGVSFAHSQRTARSSGAGQDFRRFLGSGRRKRAAVVALLLAGVAAPSQVFAQEAGGQTTTLGEISVVGEGRGSANGAAEGYVTRATTSGTKTSTPLVETPQSISVVTAKQMNDQRVQSVGEALAYTPGVMGQTFGADPRYEWFLLRGFRAEEAGYFLDGMQLYNFNYGTFQLEPWGLQSIDVLRGPSSSLYGGGNPGGVVNSVSKLPTFSRFGTVETGVNSFGNAFAALDAGGVAGAADEWSWRIATLGRAGGTQVDHTDFDRAFVAPSVSYRPNDQTQLTLYGSYTYTNSAAQNFLPYYGTVKRASFGKIPTSFFLSDPDLDRFEREQAMIGYKVEHELDSGVKLRSQARYAHADVHQRSLYGFNPVAGQGDSLIERRNFLSDEKTGLFTLDNQAEMSFATGPLAHTALVGVDYKRFDQKAFDADWDGTPIDILDPVQTPQAASPGPYFDGRTKFDQIGVYAQDQIKFDRLSVLLGGRYDYVDTVQTNTAFGAYDRQKSSDGKFSGRAGLLYRLDGGFAPYISYSTSFNPIVGLNAQGTLFKPETGEQWEAGVKYEAPNLPITASVAVFDLTRAHVSTTDPNNPILQDQTGEQRSRGVEAEVRATLAEGWSLIGAFTAYELEVTKDKDGSRVGKTPPNTPQTFASLWLDYTIPSGPYKGLGIGGGLRYVGRSTADFVVDPNTGRIPKVPAATVGDLSLHYDNGTWRAALNVSNVADKKYVSSCVLIASCYYADRRRATVSVAYRW